jgi:hypothetical protein
MPAPERASWQNPKVLTTLLMVFVAGAFTGALCMRWGLHERLHHGSASTATWKDPHAAKAFLDRCRKDLNLSPKQADEMATILDDYKQYYQSLQDQMDDIRGTGKNRIMQILDKTQQQKFERMLAEIPK